MYLTTLYNDGYTAKKITETNSGSIISKGLSTDTTIGNSGVFYARYRQLSEDEIIKNSKLEVVTDGRIYTSTSGLTNKHYILDPDGMLHKIVKINNPHQLNKFYQIDVIRSDEERIRE